MREWFGGYYKKKLRGRRRSYEKGLPESGERRSRGRGRWRGKGFILSGQRRRVDVARHFELWAALQREGGKDGGE